VNKGREKKKKNSSPTEKKRKGEVSFRPEVANGKGRLTRPLPSTEEKKKEEFRRPQRKEGKKGRRRLNAQAERRVGPSEGKKEIIREGEKKEDLDDNVS